MPISLVYLVSEPGSTRVSHSFAIVGVLPAILQLVSSLKVSSLALGFYVNVSSSLCTGLRLTDSTGAVQGRFSEMGCRVTSVDANCVLTID